MRMMLYHHHRLFLPPSLGIPFQRLRGPVTQLLRHNFKVVTLIFSWDRHVRLQTAQRADDGCSVVLNLELHNLVAAGGLVCIGLDAKP